MLLGTHSMYRRCKNLPVSSLQAAISGPNLTLLSLANPGATKGILLTQMFSSPEAFQSWGPPAVCSGPSPAKLTRPSLSLPCARLPVGMPVSREQCSASVLCAGPSSEPRREKSCHLCLKICSSMDKGMHGLLEALGCPTLSPHHPGSVRCQGEIGLCVCVCV